MQLAQSKPFMQRHKAWLLWLVLLLPLAQAAASWHVLSHANSGQLSEPDDQQTLHQANCELCLSAAALLSGAPLVATADLPHAPALAQQVAADWRTVLWKPAARAYDSRAPPFSLR
ncbi:MAG: hypothetical protein NTX31_17510 [Burkholderiales bacterium]|jgi:hypothetical protein|nr:hypothetical protein [Burkholderiales bacterium]